MTIQGRKISISAIIPVYHPGSFLTEAIQSILQQTEPIQEILLINDGGEQNLVEKFIPNNDRITLFSKPNGGVASARNYGIRQAKGEYIAFLDQDDYWMPLKIEFQKKLISETPSMIISPIIDINETGKINPNTEKLYAEAIKKKDLRASLLSRNFIYSSSPLVHRKIFEHVGLFNPAMDPHDDWDFYLRVAFSHFPIIMYQGAPLSAWRRHNSNTSSNILKMNRTKMRVLKSFIGTKNHKLSNVAKQRYDYESFLRLYNLLFKQGFYAKYSRYYFHMVVGRRKIGSLKFFMKAIISQFK